jgi:hypothetical protein
MNTLRETVTHSSKPSGVSALLAASSTCSGASGSAGSMPVDASADSITARSMTPTTTSSGTLATRPESCRPFY